MTTRQFSVANANIFAGDIMQCKEKTYKGTTDKIVWVPLTRNFEGQNYLVLSHNAAKALLSKKKNFEELEVSYSDDIRCWGITMPSSSTVLMAISL